VFVTVATVLGIAAGVIVSRAFFVFFFARFFFNTVYLAHPTLLYLSIVDNGA
jgi:hypothetical protein